MTERDPGAWDRLGDIPGMSHRRRAFQTGATYSTGDPDVRIRAPRESDEEHPEATPYEPQSTPPSEVLTRRETNHCQKFLGEMEQLRFPNSRELRSQTGWRLRAYLIGRIPDLTGGDADEPVVYLCADGQLRVEISSDEYDALPPGPYGRPQRPDIGHWVTRRVQYTERIDVTSAVRLPGDIDMSDYDERVDHAGNVVDRHLVRERWEREVPAPYTEQVFERLRLPTLFSLIRKGKA